MLIYIHGFNSSPHSSKAKAAVEYFASKDASCLVPALSPNTAAAIEQLKLLCTAAGKRAFLAGSSLGGFYATWLVENGYAPAAALINPAVAANEKLASVVGTMQRNYHTDAEYEYRQQYVDDLARLEVKRVRDPQRYLLLVQTGDELLDWREADKCYSGCTKVIEQGGDHGFVDFARHLPEIYRRAQAPG